MKIGQAPLVGLQFDEVPKKNDFFYSKRLNAFPTFVLNKIVYKWILNDTKM